MNYPQQLISWSLDLIFPVKCLICRRYDRQGKEKYICKSCFRSLPLRNSFECIGCKKPAPLGKTCRECIKIFKIDQLLIVSDYKNPDIEKILKFLKYRFIKDLCRPISLLARKYIVRTGKLKKHNIIADNPAVIAVPMHKRRLNWRGFNQSEEIAKILADSFQLDFLQNVLLKIKSSPPQADISDKEDRFKNITSAFTVEHPHIITGRVIILIDDICTTGATLNECAKILKESGAVKVIGLVIARG